MKKNSLVFAVAMSSLLAVSASAANDAVVLKQARELQLAKKYDEAIKLYENGIKSGATERLYVDYAALLINLKKMRKENISQKFFDFIDNNKNKLAQEDQTVINIVLHGRIDLLPPKFGMWNFLNKESVLSHNHYGDKKLGIKAYNDEEILKDWQKPSILHYSPFFMFQMCHPYMKTGNIIALPVLNFFRKVMLLFLFFSFLNSF